MSAKEPAFSMLAILTPGMDALLLWRAVLHIVRPVSRAPGLRHFCTPTLRPPQLPPHTATCLLSKTALGRKRCNSKKISFVKFKYKCTNLNKRRVEVSTLKTWSIFMQARNTVKPSPAQISSIESLLHALLLNLPLNLPSVTKPQHWLCQALTTRRSLNCWERVCTLVVRR